MPPPPPPPPPPAQPNVIDHGVGSGALWGILAGLFAGWKDAQLRHQAQCIYDNS